MNLNFGSLLGSFINYELGSSYSNGYGYNSCWGGSGYNYGSVWNIFSDLSSCSSCSNSSRTSSTKKWWNNWSTGAKVGVLGGIAVAIGLGVLFKGHQTKTAERDAIPTQLQSEINNYNSQIKEKLAILGIAESEFNNNYDPNAKYNKLNGELTGLKTPLENANTRVKNADELVANAENDYNLYNEEFKTLAGVASRTPEQEARYKELQTALSSTGTYGLARTSAKKEKADADAEFKKAQEQYDAKNKEVEAEKQKIQGKSDAKTALIELIEKRKAAQEKLDAIQMNKDIDNADGNIFNSSRNKGLDKIIGNDGDKAASKLSLADWRGLIYKYTNKKADKTEKGRIQEFISNNWDNIASCKLPEDVKNMLEQIKNDKDNKVRTSDI